MAKPNQDNLKKLKDMVENSRKSFAANYTSFNASKSFLFVSSIGNDDKDKLTELGRPTLKATVLEAYVSRLRGEFSIQNPEINVKPVNDTLVDIKTTDVVNNIIRSIFYKAQSDNLDNIIYKDILGGGFSVLKIWTDYCNEQTFDQEICVGAPYDVTLCGFDPLAVKPHKGDGNFCYELIPKRLSEFEEEYPDADTTDLKFPGLTNNFRWSYSNKEEKVLFICDLYEKVYKFVNMVQLADGQIMTRDEYKTLVELIDLDGSPIVPPAIIENARRKTFKIIRWRFSEKEILEKIETDFNFLPLVFFDGDSVRIQQKQITRPYIYNAVDCQRAKNIIFNTILDEIQNMRRTTLVMSQRALPTDPTYLQPYLNPDRSYASYIYNDLDENKNPIAPPIPLERSSMPPEVFAMFQGLDSTIQASLGSYDAQAGIQDEGMSGRAIIASTTQSNAAAKPFMINFVASMSHVANGIVDLIPKYYITPRTIPVVDGMGKRSYQRINDSENPDSINIDYSPNDLDVYVKEGVSFEAQKNQALSSMTQLATVLPGLNQLLSTKGLPILLDNLDVRGADTLKLMAEQMIEEASNQPNQVPPDIQLAQQKQAFLERQEQNDMIYKEQQLQLEHLKLAQDDKDNLVKLQLAEQDMWLEMQRITDEKARTQAQLRLQHLGNAISQYQFLVNKHHDLARDEAAELAAKTQQPMGVNNVVAQA